MTNPVQPIDNKVTKEQGAAACSSSTTTTSHGPGCVSPFDLEKIRLEYLQILGPLNIHKARILNMAINNGMEADVIVHAIEETAMAPNPSHYYLHAILARYIDDHILTMADVVRDEMQRRARREAKLAERESAWYDAPTKDELFPY